MSAPLPSPPPSISPLSGTPLSVAQALQLAAESLQAGRNAEGEHLCLKVLEVDTENAQALHLLGVLAHLAGKQGPALALIEKAVRCEPRHPQAHYNLGVVLGVLRRHEEALASYRKAVALDPSNANALNNLGNVALELNLNEEALAAYETLLARSPEDPNVALARAITLYAMRRFDLAAPAYERALVLAPHEPRQHWEASHQYLMTGDFARGWEHYESRFATAQANVWCYPYPFPRWQGEPLAAKTLLLHGEQGLGDEIMCASIYPELIAEAGQVLICCQPHLAPLFRDSFPGVRVEPQIRIDADAWTRRPADWLAGAPAIDYQIPFGSLPRLRRRSLAQFPAHDGYLRADVAKSAAWAAKLAQLRGLRVGVCWAANPAVEDPTAARRSRNKSLTLQQLEPLLEVAQADFISLQTWEAAAQVSAAAPATRARILDASSGLGDFADTAALMMNLDLVITVDTSVAHLAGALGKPVWILLPWQADWRWHAAGAGTEWYPQARLYRQPVFANWATPIAQMRDDLQALAQAAPPARGPFRSAEMTA